MSLNLNQRIDAFKKHTLKHHVFVASSRYSVLAIALSAVVLSPSITAKPLLDVNQPSTVVQGTSSFEQVLAQADEVLIKEAPATEFIQPTLF